MWQSAKAVVLVFAKQLVRLVSGMADAHRWRPVAAAGLVTVLMLSYAVAMSLPGRPAAAAELPPGGLVDSADDFGWTQGEFSVSDDGAAQYRLPLWVPEGRGAVAPELALSYHSRGDNGPLGVGWSLAGLPSITWCPHSIAQDGFTDGGHFDGADPLCLGDNRLVPASGPGAPEREYRTEQETFARITAFGTIDNVPDSFRVEAKDGRIMSFGQSGDSRLTANLLRAGTDLENPSLERAPGDPVTVSWALNRVEDRNGNAATVTYQRAAGGAAELWWVEMLPATITYAPNRSVTFRYESRQDWDPIDGFIGGVHSRISQRMIGVEMRGGPLGAEPGLLREYRFAYRNDSITGRSLLRSIRECDGGGECKRALELDYSEGSYDYEEIDAGSIDTGDMRWGDLVVSDVDGDGRDDLFYRPTPIDQTQRTEYVVRRGNGSGFDGPVSSGLPPYNNTFFSVWPSPRQGNADGDGLTDAIFPWCGEDDCAGGVAYWQLFQSDGDRLAQATGDVGEPLPPDEFVEGGYLADLDGNGLPDFVSSVWDGFDPGLPYYRLNTGGDGAERFAPPHTAEVDPWGGPNVGVGSYVVDTDGDGRAELIKQRGSVFDCVGKGWSGWGRFPLGGEEGVSANLRPCSNGWTHFGDLNGDGLEDAVTAFPATNPETNPGHLEVQLNSGNGFGSHQTVPNPPGYVGPQLIPAQFVDQGSRVADFNNDGRDDILVYSMQTSTEHQPTLYTWKDNSFVGTPLNVDIGDWRGVPGTVEGMWDWGLTQPLDVNADGLLDIVRFDVKEERILLYMRQGGVPDQLVGIGNAAYGPRVEVSYTTLADRDTHTPGTCDYPLACPARGGTVVEQHQVSSFVGDDGAVFWDIYRHRYEAARTDLQGRGWLGFAEHSVTRSWTGATTVTELDNVTRDPDTGSYPYAHLPKQVTYTVTDVTGPEGREFQQIVVNRHAIRPSAGAYRVELQHIDTTERERPVGEEAWQALRHHTTDITYDGFGNTDVTTAATSGGRTLTVDVDYRNDTNAWLIGLATRAVATGCDVAGRCATRLSAFDYDVAGNHTVTVVEPDQPALRLTTTAGYGEFGNITSITRTDSDDRSRTDTYEYEDDEQLYPTAAVNARGHRMLIETDQGLGVPTRITDPNGVPATMRYDRFGRLRETYLADGGFERIEHDGSGSWPVVTTTTAGGGARSVVMDQLGQERERRVTSFDGRIATTYLDHDVLGRGVWQVSRPVLPGEARHDTRAQYDNRGRIVRVTAPDGAEVRYEYRNLETHAFDPTGGHTYTVENADGDVGSSIEGALQTRFGYGPFGDLATVVAPDDTVRELTYDVLGRRTSLTDPSSGTTTSTYTAFGEVATETDGTGATTTYTYDELGRVRQVDSPDGRETYTWDTAPNGLGRLASAGNASNVSTSYTYNDAGQQTAASWQIAGQTYEFLNGYDVLGRLSSITYPRIPDVTSRLAVTYAYNEHGYLEQVHNAAPGGQVYWTALGRDGAGQLTQERHGNVDAGVITDYTYQPETGLLTNLTATGPGIVGQLANIDYEHDLNRNVTRRHDIVNKRDEIYGYDSLNRLDDWHTQSNGEGYLAIQASYAYDQLGNLTGETFQRPGEPQQGLTYHYGEDGAPPHALTSRSGDGTAECPGCSVPYTYDGAGRQVTGPQRTVAYNRLDLPTVQTWGQAGRTEYGYDADGNRVLNRDTLAGEPGQTVVTVGGLFERYTPAGTAGRDIHNVHKIMVDGRVVAQVNMAQAVTGGPVTVTRTHFLHTDGQGSTTMLTNTAGRVAESWGGFGGRYFYDPFGRRLDDQYRPFGTNRRGAPRVGYTGHEHEDHIGTINMKGRIYDPAIRRFLVPDPVVSNPLSSQSHNRYTYVLNNPSTLVDPTGFMPSAGCAAGGDLGGCMDVWIGKSLGEDNAGAGESDPLALSDPEAIEIVKAHAERTDDDGTEPTAPTASVGGEGSGGTSLMGITVGSGLISETATAAGRLETLAGSGVLDNHMALEILDAAATIRDAGLEQGEFLDVRGRPLSVIEAEERFWRSLSTLETIMGGVVIAVDVVTTVVGVTGLAKLGGRLTISAIGAFAARRAAARAAPTIALGEIKPIASYRAGLRQLATRGDASGNTALVTFDNQGAVHMQVFAESGGVRRIVWEGSIGQVSPLPAVTPGTAKFGNAMEAPVRSLVERFTGQRFLVKPPSGGGAAHGPDLVPAN